MGKQYKISELIDGYTDNEFLIEGQPGAEAEAVLSGVMTNVKPKKHLKFGGKVLLAAAVAAAVSLMAAAALPTKIYTLADGSTVNVMSDGAVMRGNPALSKNFDYIYKVENGRVYFTFDGQHLDITDEIDFDCAYWYRSEIKDNMGNTHERWIIVGGTPEHMGWFESVVDFDGKGNNSINAAGSLQYYQFYVDGEVVTLTEWEENTEEEYYAKYPSRFIDFNWYKEA